MNYQFENTIEELYSCLPNNRKKFNLIMNSMKRRFLREEKRPQKKPENKNSNSITKSPRNIFSYKPNNKTSPTKINNFDSNKLTFRKNEQNINPNIPNMPNNINNIININDNSNNLRTQRIYSSDKKLINNLTNRNCRSNRFLGTLPDALLLNPKPFRANSKQKSSLDTHANCNFYYPEKNYFYEDDIINTGNGWHNQANNIMYNTNENFYPNV